MKVRYRTIVDDVNEAIAKAREQKRTIAEIELAPKEWTEFVNNIECSPRNPTKDAVIMYEDVAIVRAKR